MEGAEHGGVGGGRMGQGPRGRPPFRRRFPWRRRPWRGGGWAQGPRFKSGARGPPGGNASAGLATTYKGLAPPPASPVNMTDQKLANDSLGVWLTKFDQLPNDLREGTHFVGLGLCGGLLLFLLFAAFAHLFCPLDQQKKSKRPKDGAPKEEPAKKPEDFSLISKKEEDYSINRPQASVNDPEPNERARNRKKLRHNDLERSDHDKDKVELCLDFYRKWAKTRKEDGLTSEAWGHNGRYEALGEQEEEARTRDRNSVLERPDEDDVASHQPFVETPPSGSPDADTAQSTQPTLPSTSGSQRATEPTSGLFPTPSASHTPTTARPLSLAVKTALRRPSHVTRPSLPRVWSATTQASPSESEGSLRRFASPPTQPTRQTDAQEQSSTSASSGSSGPVDTLVPGSTTTHTSHATHTSGTSPTSQDSQSSRSSRDRRLPGPSPAATASAPSFPSHTQPRP